MTTRTRRPCGRVVGARLGGSRPAAPELDSSCRRGTSFKRPTYHTLIRVDHRHSIRHYIRVHHRRYIRDHIRGQYSLHHSRPHHSPRREGAMQAPKNPGRLAGLLYVLTSMGTRRRRPATSRPTRRCFASASRASLSARLASSSWRWPCAACSRG